MEFNFIIYGNPVSSKNFKRAGITKNGRLYNYTDRRISAYQDLALKQLLIQKQELYYKNFFVEKKCNLHFPLTCDVNIAFIFYVSDRRKRDLINLCQCPADLLQKACIIKDDMQIKSLDGSMIAGVDKNRPRTEIIIKII